VELFQQNKQLEEELKNERQLKENFMGKLLFVVTNKINFLVISQGRRINACGRVI